MPTNFPPESDSEGEEREERPAPFVGSEEPTEPVDLPTEAETDPFEEPADNTSAEAPIPPEASSGEITDISQLPPEAQGETNGGPLGCCLGSSIGILLTVLLAVLARLYPDALNGLLVSNLRLIMACGGLLGIFVFGYLGWKIGRRLYKEYEPPVVKRRRKKKKPVVKTS